MNADSIPRKTERYTTCSIGRCRRPEYLRQGAVSCWGAGSPAKPLGIARIWRCPFLFLDCRPLWVLQRQPQLLGQRVNRGSLPLPGPFGFKPEIADATAPGGNDPADGAKVGPIGVLLIEPLHHVWRDADECAQGRCALDAVLAAVPRSAEHLGSLLQVVHEEALRFRETPPPCARRRTPRRQTAFSVPGPAAPGRRVLCPRPAA